MNAFFVNALSIVLACTIFLAAGLNSSASDSLKAATSCTTAGASWDKLALEDSELSSFSAQLQEARRLQDVGEYEQAVQAYRVLLDMAPEESPERLQASFLLGQTLYLAVDFGGAADAFLAFAEQYPNDEMVGPAVFLAGQAYYSLGSWSEAITQYQRYLTIDDTVASFVYEVMGDSYLAAQDYASAVEAYRRGLEGPVDRLMRIHLLEGIAEAQDQSAQYADLASTYDEILEHAQGADYRARTQYLAGQALAAAGNVDESLKRYIRAVEDHPTAYHSYLSLIEIVNAGYPVDEFQRGLVDYYGGAYGPAVQAFDRYIASVPEGYSGEAHYYAGLSYKEAGDPEKAVAQLDSLISDYPESKFFGSAWIAKGQTWADVGSTDKAIEIWADFLKTYPDDALAPDAFWLSGELWEGQDRFEEAIYNYTELHAHYPETERAPAALYRAGLLSFRTQAYEQAANALRALVNGYNLSPLRPAALFWLAKVLHAVDNDEGARAYLDELKDGYPGTYYAVRGQEFGLTWSSKLFQSPPQTNMLLSGPTPEEQAEAETWLLGWSSVQPAEGESASGLPAALAEDGRLKRGLILWTLDLTSDATVQIRSLKNDINDSPLDLYRVGLLLQREGLYRQAVSYIDRLVELAPPERQMDVPVFLRKLTHPFHFSDLLVAQAVELGVDPLLLFALVRQESNFEWHVQSWAGAQGLMQIMPATADWIALQLGWSDFSQDLIYRPNINVHFGTWYFSHQLSSFDGDVTAALAAYNAGPGRISRWQTPEMAQDDDLLLEYMPLEEPRLYVEKVYTHYDIYRGLYAR